MRRILIFCILGGIFLTATHKTGKQNYLTKKEMGQIWAGWTCINTNQCKTNPVAPGGFKECYYVINYTVCVGLPWYENCLGCDEWWGGVNKYCIGPNIGIPCWRQNTSCGPQFHGNCANNEGLKVCVVAGDAIPNSSCGVWNQCKNE